MLKDSPMLYEYDSEFVYDTLVYDNNHDIVDGQILASACFVLMTQNYKANLGGGNWEPNVCYFQPYLVKISNLTNVFQMG